MELIDYLIRIWHRKWIVIIAVITAIMLNAGIMYMLPRQYKATAVVEIGGIQSFLANPGQVRDGSRQSLPSSVQPETQSYLMLSNTPVVYDEAKKIVQVQPGNAGQVIHFDFQIRAEPVRGTGTDVIYLAASADNPVVAKDAADALANVLVSHSRDIESEVANGFVENLQSQQINPINSRLADIRDEVENIKANPDLSTAYKNGKVAGLNDEVKSLEDTRKQYTDAIARVRLNEELSKNYLSVVSAAVLPNEKEAPNILKGGVIAGILGFVIGISLIVVSDMKSGVFRIKSVRVQPANISF